jgi:hypothetical protein
MFENNLPTRIFSLRDRKQEKHGESCAVIRFETSPSPKQYVVRLRYQVLTAEVMESAVHSDVTLCSLVQRYEYFGGTPASKFRARECSTLRKEAVGISEKLITFYQTTRCIL